MPWSCRYVNCLSIYHSRQLFSYTFTYFIGAGSPNVEDADTCKLVIMLDSELTPLSHSYWIFQGQYCQQPRCGNFLQCRKSIPEVSLFHSPSPFLCSDRVFSSCDGEIGNLTVNLGGSSTIDASITANLDLGVALDGISLGGGISATIDGSQSVSQSQTFDVSPGRQAILTAGVTFHSQTGNVQVNYPDRINGHFEVCPFGFHLADCWKGWLVLLVVYKCPFNSIDSFRRPSRIPGAWIGMW